MQIELLASADMSKINLDKAKIMLDIDSWDVDSITFKKRFYVVNPDSPSIDVCQSDREQALLNFGTCGTHLLAF